jgi:hypothetical protein
MQPQNFYSLQVSPVAAATVKVGLAAVTAAPAVAINARATFPLL